MKAVIKGFLIFLSGALLYANMAAVDAWFGTSRYPYTNVADFTIDTASWPDYFDILIISDEAPLRSEAELALRLPVDYRSGPFADVVNGYRDADGFASFRLYHEDLYQITQVASDKYEYLFVSSLPMRAKILLVFDDGTSHVSTEFLLTQNTADVVYDLMSVAIEESTFVEPDPFVFEPPHPAVVFIQEFQNQALTTFVIVNVVVQLAYLWMLGYRRPQSFFKVGLCRLFIVTMGAICLILEIVFPSIPFGLIFAVSYVTWMFVESLKLPLWLNERTLKRTMLFSWTSNLTILFLLLFFYMQFRLIY